MTTASTAAHDFNVGDTVESVMSGKTGKVIKLLAEGKLLVRVPINLDANGKIVVRLVEAIYSSAQLRRITF